MATVTYGLSLLAIRLLFFALSAYTRGEHLGHTGPADADMEEMNKKFRVVVAGYVGTILLGLFFPSAAIAVYLAIAIFLFVPFRAVIHALSGGSGN